MVRANFGKATSEVAEWLEGLMAVSATDEKQMVPHENMRILMNSLVFQSAFVLLLLYLLVVIILTKYHCLLIIVFPCAMPGTHFMSNAGR